MSFLDASSCSEIIFQSLCTFFFDFLNIRSKYQEIRLSFGFSCWRINSSIRFPYKSFLSYFVIRKSQSCNCKITYIRQTRQNCKSSSPVWIAASIKVVVLAERHQQSPFRQRGASLKSPCTVYLGEAVGTKPHALDKRETAKPRDQHLDSVKCLRRLTGPARVFAIAKYSRVVRFNGD